MLVMVLLSHTNTHFDLNFYLDFMMTTTIFSASFS